MLKTALKVLKKIEDNGYQAYIVGGFVRDYLLGRDSLDVDIATSATPKELMSIFENSALPKEEYGAVTLFLKNYRFEITTFRREIKYENNRKPVEIQYIDDLLEDLRRRDFKMNTLCMNQKKEIIDLLNGKEDIEHQVICTVGDSNGKFREDSLRMLRAIRFATILNFRLSGEVKRAILNQKHSLKNLSYQRKRQELDKIFSSSNVSYGIKLLLELGLDKELELYNLGKVRPCGSLLGMWSSLEFNPKYPFSSNEKEIMKNVRKVLNSSISRLSLYQYGLYVNQLAAEIKGEDKMKITHEYEMLPITSRKDIDITGEEIMELLSQKGGPIFQEIYHDLENKILEGTLRNQKDSLKKYIQESYHKGE